MAIVLAQKLNGHGFYCGTRGRECKACEGVADGYMADGVQAMRERAGCQLAWQSEAGEREAIELATHYYRLIRPGRVELWRAPVWMTEIAEIGDLVQAQAEREIYEQVSKSSKGK